MSSQTPAPPQSINGAGTRRIQARLALALLESLRYQDQPEEILDDENVTITLPRRFGLSDVVDSRIRRYRVEARKGRRVPEPEIRDLITLMTRRPDAARLFHRVGRSLSELERGPRLRRVLPARAVRALAARRLRRYLRALFGGRFARTSGRPFRLEVVDDLLVDPESSGDACALITGMTQSVMDAYGIADGTVVHEACRSLGDGQCRWVIEGATTPSREALDGE